jgi:hypothetical protein
MSNQSFNKKLQDVDDIKTNYQNDFGSKYLPEYQNKDDTKQNKTSIMNNVKEMISVFILSKNKLLVILLLCLLLTMYVLYTIKPKWIMNTNDTNNTNIINNYRLISYSLVIGVSLSIFILSIIYYKFPIQYKNMLFTMKNDSESNCSVCIE